MGVDGRGEITCQIPSENEEKERICEGGGKDGGIFRKGRVWESEEV